MTTMRTMTTNTVITKVSTTIKDVTKMARKSVIKPRTVWPTSDGQVHSTEIAAKEHELMLTIKSVLTKDKEIKNAVDKADLPALFNKHFEAILDAAYERGLTPTHYGLREDF